MGGESCTSPFVPSFKSQLLPPTSSPAGNYNNCPICMHIIKDAFLAACGHSFCYTCISTHLSYKNDCPSCARYLTSNLIFPNFLLDKILKRTAASQISTTASPVDYLQRALHQGCEVSVKEIDELLHLLNQKKREMEQEEVEKNMHILLDFLCSLRKKKLEHLSEIQTDLQLVMEDIDAVESRRMTLNREKSISSSTVHMLANDPDSKSALQSGLALTRKGGTLQFNELQEYYLKKRRHWATLMNKKEEKDEQVINKDGYNPGLEDFESVLANFTRYSQLKVFAQLRHADLFHSANIVSSIEFDRDDELFATAGVSKRIKVFDFHSVVNEPADVHCPIVELPARSKLSCISWNKYSKNHIASCDYEGIVTIWDVNTHQSLMEYEEHESRAWSVDFAHTEPSMLVSGSDDRKVKIWCTKQEKSVFSIDMKANICSVKYNPGSSIFVAVGSADHHIHYYDLRNTKQALGILKGHRKAVSYVKFVSNNHLASSSTDSTLHLWDVKENMLMRTFRGHSNEKNFVGLTVNSEYIACGSETNEVFVYHKAISKAAARHRFVSNNENGGDVKHFVSSVCWKRDSRTMLAANSRGIVEVLVLAA